MTQNSSSSLCFSRSWTRVFGETKSHSVFSHEGSASRRSFWALEASQTPLKPSNPHLFDRLEQLRGSIHEKAVLSLRASAELSSRFKNDEEEVDRGNGQNAERRHFREVPLLARTRSFLKSMPQGLEQTEDEESRGADQNLRTSPSLQQLRDDTTGSKLQRHQGRSKMECLSANKSLSSTDSVITSTGVLGVADHQVSCKGEKVLGSVSQPITSHAVPGMRTQSLSFFPEVIATEKKVDSTHSYEPPQKRGRQHISMFANTTLNGASPSQMRQSWFWSASTDNGVKTSKNSVVIDPSSKENGILPKEAKPQSSLGWTLPYSGSNLKVTSVFKMGQDNVRQDKEHNSVLREDEGCSSSPTGNLTSVAAMRLAVHDKGHLVEASQGSVHTDIVSDSQGSSRRKVTKRSRKQASHHPSENGSTFNEVKRGNNTLAVTDMRYIVFDTSSLLESDPGVLNLLVERCVICIPFTVIDELDKLNKGICKTLASPEMDLKREWLRHRSREIRNFLLAQQKCVQPDTPEVCRIRIQRRTEVIPEYHGQPKCNDDYILEFAVYLKEKEKLHPVIFVSEDKFLCIKAKTELGNSCSYADLKHSFGLRP
ncbi:unnamed protein product [Phytomonas sp. EM1]|nr:unnamed protein product [Phytomonas sp. EM1]|eukprot:CCW61798.1 unnamed protein product [Phytomonas sp. isolate EM1]